jgi:glycosyltransferase involved in cell wall biosynthesis
MHKPATQFIFFAYAASGKGISGSDRIFIELAKRWSSLAPLTLFVWEEGFQMYKRLGLVSTITPHVASMEPWCRFGFFINYFARIFYSIYIALTLNLKNESSTIIYSASEFWMDSLPAFVLKMRYKKARWVAAWFQTAPNPLKGFASGDREKTYKMSAFFYWFVQLPIKPIISQYADYVLINNETEKKQFIQLNRKKRAIVLIGAVDLKDIEKFKQNHKKIVKLYDAVFQGRFHPQKGVVELVQIWKKVVLINPKAKLVMIGDGPLMDEVKEKIENLQLQKNIILTGYLFDGIKKYTAFLQSKLVLHPAFYDSGGMAAAEAMAFGLPTVGFNLQAYDSYYPKGMVKAKYGDINDFAMITSNLLKDDKLREKIGKEGEKMIYDNYSWDKRAEQIYKEIERN